MRLSENHQTLGMKLPQTRSSPHTHDASGRSQHDAAASGHAVVSVLEEKFKSMSDNHDRVRSKLLGTPPIKLV